VNSLEALRMWGRRRWFTASVGTLGSLLVLGLPTDLVSNPVFGRQVAAPWWAWPILVATSVLSGLLLATYVRGEVGGGLETLGDGAGHRGALGGVLAFFAVGCPVCNKLALVALGYAGALRWFAPIQPYLGTAALILLAWALRMRLRGQSACPTPRTPHGVEETVAVPQD
jgi:hypothetical protein